VATLRVVAEAGDQAYPFAESLDVTGDGVEGWHLAALDAAITRTGGALVPNRLKKRQGRCAESAAHRPRPDRPGEYPAGPPAGEAVEPARRLGRLPLARPPRAGQRGRLHRRPGDQRPAWPRWIGHTPVPLLAGLIRCGTCGRRLESSWSNGRAAHRCRHGVTSACRCVSIDAQRSISRCTADGLSSARCPGGSRRRWAIR
jgi:hypothetical protein